jgi:Asp/Glu/hydantoin racemase
MNRTKQLNELSANSLVGIVQYALTQVNASGMKRLSQLHDYPRYERNVYARVGHCTLIDTETRIVANKCSLLQLYTKSKIRALKVEITGSSPVCCQLRSRLPSFIKGAWVTRFIISRSSTERSL